MPSLPTTLACKLLSLVSAVFDFTLLSLVALLSLRLANFAVLSLVLANWTCALVLVAFDFTLLTLVSAVLDYALLPLFWPWSC
ncbi:hypothetical protein PF005_g12164 [Phytophthora fragariae]|uniref:Uncharacterized protein n=1 Tax=Phytophthora fragariae TaxID=53985 RepID=A0A6A3Z459_9STRA|nr:hypothetical protein PF003_g24251 [Phytophthora fragariae]KAE8943580.1 hypothetical protein PF009_g6691 [Phytophthora fragariae]KAE9006443.1 hypothetical protein PF011_g11586 [Phytophthora fragariae]KAE9109372.1 hypothetical protein PF007_g12268 [Phytophthora fragariae]KAE9130819.1 hypothetical protein PF006_g15673 [Phytophthora fragariae]